MTTQTVLLRRLSMGLCMIGLLISSYLAWARFESQSTLCLGGSKSCDIVQQSTYSTVAGIPIALIGLAGYLLILGLHFAETKGGGLANQAPLVIFGLTLLGVAYSGYLTYLELFVILAICQYCVASAVVMAILFGIATYRILAAVG